MTLRARLQVQKILTATIRQSLGTESLVENCEMASGDCREIRVEAATDAFTVSAWSDGRLRARNPVRTADKRPTYDGMNMTFRRMKYQRTKIRRLANSSFQES